MSETEDYELINSVRSSETDETDVYHDGVVVTVETAVVSHVHIVTNNDKRNATSIVTRLRLKSGS